jgi:hypothetical protein
MQSFIFLYLDRVCIVWWFAICWIIQGFAMKIFGRGLGCMAMLLVLTACQREEHTDLSHPVHSTQTNIPLIQAKSIAVKLPQAEICEQMGCTRYDLQTIQTNVAWINDYFLDRLKKMDPIAFEKYEGPQLDNDSLTALGLNQSRSHVQYLGQNGIFATFLLHSYNYNAGATHGLYHDEYVNFDLNEQKRIALQDLLITGMERQFADALYEQNALWLQNHGVAAETLQLSDNFYFDQKGLVMVYPLYALAAYSEGMTKLSLPYERLHKWVKPEYLPALPHYIKEQLSSSTDE